MKLTNYNALDPNVFFSSGQISMNALQIPVRVTRTLIARTAKVLTVVLANKDLLKMVQLVKVSSPSMRQNHSTESVAD